MKILLVILLIGCTKKEEPKPTPINTRVDVYIAYCFLGSSQYDEILWERGRDYNQGQYKLGDKIDWTIERSGTNSFIIDGHDKVTSQLKNDYGTLFVKITIYRWDSKRYTYLNGQGDKQHFYEQL